MDRHFKGYIGLVLLGWMAPSALAWGASCGTAFTQVDYSARFDWGGKKARIQVGLAKEKGRLHWVARIDSRQGCQAYCEVQRLEVDRFRASAPVSLDLKCRSSRFSPLETRATVLWVNEIQREPVLRFGTWLSGYEDVSLSVEQDALIPEKVSAKIIAKNSSF